MDTIWTINRIEDEFGSWVQNYLEVEFTYSSDTFQTLRGTMETLHWGSQENTMAKK